MSRELVFYYVCFRIMLFIFGEEVKDELLDDVLQYAQFVATKENGKLQKPEPSNKIRIKKQKQ